jgi:hypothetical protein
MVFILSHCFSPYGRVGGFHNGKNPFAVSKDGITDIRNAFQDAVINLGPLSNVPPG